MNSFDARLQACGVPAETRLILCYYFRPEILQAVVESLEGGDADVGACESESAKRAR